MYHFHHAFCHWHRRCPCPTFTTICPYGHHRTLSAIQTTYTLLSLGTDKNLDVDSQRQDIEIFTDGWVTVSEKAQTHVSGLGRNCHVNEQKKGTVTVETERARRTVAKTLRSMASDRSLCLDNRTLVSTDHLLIKQDCNGR